MSVNGVLLSARCSDGSNYSIRDTTIIPAHDASNPCEFHNVWKSAGEGSKHEFTEAWQPVLDTCLQGGFPKQGFCAIVTQGATPDEDYEVFRGNTEASLSYLLANGVGLVEAQFLSVYNDVCKDIINDHSYKHHPSKVKVSVDDKHGAIFEGASKHTIQTTSELTSLMNIVQDCLPTNDTVRNRTHVITSMSLYQSGEGVPTTLLSRLFIIQTSSYCFGSTAFSDRQSGLRHRKQLKSLSQCLTGIASGKNFTTLRFKDSKITRILQHPLHHMLKSQSYNVSFIEVLTQDIELHADVISQLATISLLTWKRTNLDNISNCKDMLRILEGKISTNAELNQESAVALQAAEAACELKQEEIEGLKEQVIANDERLAQKRKQAEAQYRKERTEREEKYSTIMQEGIAATRQELQAAKDMVSGADGAVEESIRLLRKQHEEDRYEYSMKLNLAITAEREATDSLVFQISSNERRIDQLLEWENRVQKELRQLQKEHDFLSELFQNTQKGESRTAGLTPKEIESKQEQFMLLDELFDTEQSQQRYRDEIRALKMETGVEVQTDSESESDYGSLSPRRDMYDDNYDTTPPASSSSSSISSSSSSVVSSFSSLSSSSSDGKKHSNLKSKMKKSALSLERRQFEFTIKREDNLRTLVENIMKFMEYGSFIVLVQEQSPHLTRQFGYLDHSRNNLLFCSSPTDKQTVLLRTPIDSIRHVTLGQHHPAYDLVRRSIGLHYDPAEDPPPPTPAHSKDLISNPNTLPGYYYRSICLELNNGRSLCFIADTDNDFEAWLVALHNRVRKFPRYNIPLGIERHNSVSRLNEGERRFCADNHITPRNYLNAKYDVLNSRRVLITLLDVRTASTLNLVHAQQLFQHLCETGHIKQAILWAVSNPDDKKKQKDVKQPTLFDHAEAAAAAAVPAAPSMKPSVSDLQKLAKNI